MLVLLWMLLPLLVANGDASTFNLSARSGEAALLPCNLQHMKMSDADDWKWTHERLSLSWKSGVKKCKHGRCEILSNGSLSFSHVLLDDVGRYRLEVFDRDGTRLMRRDFLLTVDGVSAGGGGSGTLLAPMLSCLLLPLLLLLSLAVFILRKRMRPKLSRAAAAGSQRQTCPKEENVYVQMHSFHGNRGKGVAEKQKQVEEPVYVPHHPTVSMDADASDIYV